MPEPTYCSTGADFSPDRVHRYRLWRTWDAELPVVAFIMLNPSTADEHQLDPTLRRVLGYAQAWGYGGFIIGNLFALRSTDPEGLYVATDPIGPGNDDALLRIAHDADLIVCGWGDHGRHQWRGDSVRRRLNNAGHVLHALRFTRAGEPGHPLYLPGNLRPARW